jgi:DNA replication protein DnaC
MKEKSIAEIVQERTQNKNSQTPSEIEVVCEDCSVRFKTEQVFFRRRDLTSTCCPPCQRERDARYERARVEDERRRAEEARRKVFEAEVPPLYRTTPTNRIDPILLKAADTWIYSPKGLGMVGETGQGKTSAIVRTLERQCKEGKSICFTSAVELSEKASEANQYEEGKKAKREAAERRLTACKESDITFLDDLGKSKLTERGESTLYEVLEYRYSHMLPVFWTSNSSAGELLKKFSPDRGLAIIRRLKETSEITSQYKD